MSIANKLSYLNETREQIREGLNKLGGNISKSDTFRSYADKIEEIYDSMPKVEESNVESGTLEGTIKGGLDIDLKGNTSQYSTTGKNVLAPYTTTTSRNGITCTYDSTTQTYTFNGTCDTDNTLFRIGSSEISFTQGTTTSSAHYVSGSVTGYASIRHYDNAYYKLVVYSILDISSSTPIISATSSETFISPQDQSTIRFNNGSKAENLKIKIMVAQSTNTSYEPYTNGASPNPDYPQVIHTINGDNEVVVCGKNLFDKDTENFDKGYYLDNNGAKQISANWGIYDIQVKPNTSYVVSGATRNDGAYFWWLDENKTPISMISSHRDIVATSPNNAKNISMSIVWNTSSSAYDEDTFMLEANSQATSYEPYQSQTYPIYLGVENLFDKDNVVKVENKILNDNGVEIDDNGGGYTKMYIPVQPNTNYTISGLPQYATKRIYFFDSSKQWLSRTSGYANVSSFSFTTPNNCKHIDIQYVLQDNNFNTYQIEKGSTTHEYTPYGKALELCKIGDYQDYFTKNSGKNLFDKDNANIITNKYLNASGVETSDSNFSISDYIKVKPSTSYSLTPFQNMGACVCFYDSSKTFISSGALYSVNPSLTTPNNCEYIRSSFRKENLNTIMLNEGTTALPYEPYGTGKWCKYNAIGKVVLDGSESWQSENVNTKINYYINLPSALGSDTSTTCISNYFTGATGQQSYDSTTLTNIVGIGGSKRLRIRGTTFATKSDFTTWLSTHNTTLDYVLANPYLSLIEDETLIEQLDNIENAMSYEGTTNIGQVNNDKAFKLDLKAILDWRNNGGE